MDEAWVRVQWRHGRWWGFRNHSLRNGCYRQVNIYHWRAVIIAHSICDHREAVSEQWLEIQVHCSYGFVSNWRVHRRCWQNILSVGHDTGFPQTRKRNDEIRSVPCHRANIWWYAAKVPREVRRYCLPIIALTLTKWSSTQSCLTLCCLPHKLPWRNEVLANLETPWHFSQTFTPSRSQWYLFGQGKCP